MPRFADNWNARWQDRHVRKDVAISRRYMERLGSLYGADDPTIRYVNKDKRLGMLSVSQDTYGFDFDSQGLTWRADTQYMNVYLPPTGEDQLDLKRLRASHHLVAQYMAMAGFVAEHQMNIGAFTSTKLARIAVRAFGARIAELPDDVLQHQAEEHESRSIYELHVRTSDPFEPAFIYQTPEDYLAFYADTDPELAAFANNPLRPPDAYTIVEFGKGAEVAYEEKRIYDPFADL